VKERGKVIFAWLCIAILVIIWACVIGWGASLWMLRPIQHPSPPAAEIVPEHVSDMQEMKKLGFEIGVMYGFSLALTNHGISNVFQLQQQAWHDYTNDKAIGFK
jgi:hypothetical protein